MCKAANTLLTAVKRDEAMLLSKLYQAFCVKIQLDSSKYPSLFSTEETHTPSRRWVLSRLHSIFGECLIMVCKHDRYGTLLFRNGCDLLKALSTALGKGTHCTCPVAECTSKSSSSEGMHKQVDNVAAYLNERVHQQAKHMILSYQGKPNMYTTFDVSTHIELLDPILLQFIQKVTQSIRSKQRKLFADQAEVNQTKKMRQLFLLASLLFCTNTQCSMPFHTLVTEATLCHGGTHELVKILNRIGAAASIDTSQRLAMQVVDSRKVNGILPELEKRALSIVSVDNIDILQPHAFISCTDATRSWHGTSVQCVQPLPTTGLLQQEELTDQIEQPCSRKHPATSPTASPIIVEKSKRRRRTLTELPSPHSTVLIPQVPSHQRPCNTGLENSAYVVPVQSVNLHDFNLNTSEKQSMNLLQGDLFKCMVLKHVAHNSHHLPNLQSLINCVRKQSSSSEESKVVYVQISSERADSRPSLIALLGRMYTTFVVEQKQNWLLVVGDAKTYDIIKSIRMEYGDQMKWLIPWPGDWHILLNYQKAVMKVYGDAGLTNLGEITQHRSETLTSLVQCTNFRRTHNFLVQSMEAFYRFFLSLYMKYKHDSTSTQQLSVEEEIQSVLGNLISELASLDSDKQLESFRSKVSTRLSEGGMEYVDYCSYMKTLPKPRHNTLLVSVCHC